jgi:hypothetical protein
MMTMKKKQKDSIERSVKKIYDLAEYRKQSGQEPFQADWQAYLETILLMMQKPLLNNPGKLLPMSIKEQKEWSFYLDVQENLDLPPNTYGVLMTPSSFEHLLALEIRESEGMKNEVLKPRDAYNVIISRYNNHSTIMQISLPGLDSVGIDVYEEGNHFADFSYNTIEECMNDLANVVWSFFRPDGAWSDEMVRMYTDNWVTRDIDMIDLDKANIHSEYSYLHHPKLLDMTPRQAVFLAIKAAVLHEYGELQDAIKMANDLNQDMDLGYAVITEEGILNDQRDECQALFSRLTVEVDMNLDGLEFVEGVKMPQRNFKDQEYNSIFRKTVQGIYRTITGRDCLSGLKL